MFSNENRIGKVTPWIYEKSKGKNIYKIIYPIIYCMNYIIIVYYYTHIHKILIKLYILLYIYICKIIILFLAYSNVLVFNYFPSGFS